MTIFASLAQLKAAAETIEMVRKFVEDSMADILREIGDIHVRVAIESLNTDSTLSRDSSREVVSALVCLKLALETYETSIKRFEKRRIFTRSGKRRILNQKACIVSCCISLCYRFLGEFNLQERYVPLCLKYFYKSAGATEGNALSDSKILIERYSAEADIAQEESRVKDFCRSMGMNNLPLHSRFEFRRWEPGSTSKLH